MGCGQRPAFPAPSRLFEGHIDCNTRADSAARRRSRVQRGSRYQSSENAMIQASQKPLQRPCRMKKAAAEAASQFALHAWLELRPRRDPDRTALARRDVVVAVSGDWASQRRRTMSRFRRGHRHRSQAGRLLRMASARDRQCEAERDRTRGQEQRHHAAPSGMRRHDMVPNTPSLTVNCKCFGACPYFALVGPVDLDRE
jgi:hypothetical protein